MCFSGACACLPCEISSAFGGNLYYPISSFGLIFFCAAFVHALHTHTLLCTAAVESFVVVCLKFTKNRKTATPADGTKVLLAEHFHANIHKHTRIALLVACLLVGTSRRNLTPLQESIACKSSSSSSAESVQFLQRTTKQLHFTNNNNNKGTVFGTPVVLYFLISSNYCFVTMRWSTTHTEHSPRHGINGTTRTPRAR